MWRFDSAAPPVCNEIGLRGSTVTRATILISALVLSWPVMGAQVYATYEGTASIQIGSGGTKVTANGIDYWTTGTPPRRYQVLEISTDARKDRLADGTFSAASLSQSVHGKRAEMRSSSMTLIQS